MANKVYQIRFFGLDLSEENITADELSSFSGIINQDSDIITNIEHITIEAIPGTIFYLNGNSFVVGITGVYEIFLNESAIQTLSFNKTSIENIQLNNLRIKEYNNGKNLRKYTPLIVNIAYNK